MKKKSAIDVNKLLIELGKSDRDYRIEQRNFIKGMVIACLIGSGFWALLGWFILSH